MVQIRDIAEEEIPLLDDILYESIFVPEGQEPFPRSILNKPEFRAYVEDFGKRAGDIGVVAEVDGEIVGASWARLIHSYGFLYEGVPEIAIALWPQWRGRGVGTQLLRGLIERLREAGFPAVSLSAQRANRAIHLYQRLGFVEEGGDDEEALMLLRL
mgnify:CR=1 FL=1